MSDAVMVPREPTEAMIEAGVLAHGRSVGFPETNGERMIRAYAAMLAASTPVGGWEDVIGTGFFLLERLADFENSITTDEDAREFDGHIAPAIARFRSAVARYAPPPPSVSTGSRPQEAVPTEQAAGAVVARLVDRFLSWKLPETFNPDGGVRFDKDSLHPAHWPSGTNLLDHTQATEMVRHILAGETR